MSNHRRGDWVAFSWHDEVQEAFGAEVMDSILGWAPGTAAWLDVQVREITAVLGEDARAIAHGAWQYRPRPFRPYSWPSCLVWVPVETAAVLAAPLEPIDIDAVRVHVRRRQNRDWQLALPDVESLGFKVPPLDGIDWRVPQLGYALPTPAELESALEGFTFHVTAPEGDMGDRFTAQLDRLRQLGYDV